jgi:polyisoprenoid-binding protein YceI
MNDKTDGRAQFLFRVAIFSVVLVVIGVGSVSASAQTTDFKVDPAKSAVKFTLDALLHKVEGTFQLEPSELQFDFTSGQASGKISVNAKSGVTGNAMRDRKMHKDVLESDQYPNFEFSPDRISGAVARSGKSSVMVHGRLGIHGVDREISVPAVVEMNGEDWNATIHFTVPYVKWGMKNPSNLFLHVADTVEIDLNAAGSVVLHSAGTSTSAQ